MFSMQRAAALVMLFCLAHLSVPAGAQTTVLTGRVNRNASRPLIVGQNAMPQTVVAIPATPQALPPQPTRTVVVERPVVRNVYIRDNRTFFQRHPKVKAAAIGAGVGTAAGAVTGLVSGRGVVRGAAIGAGTGAGVGLVRSSRTMKRHPIIRDVASGTLVGLGIGAASSRRGKRMLQGAGVGAAVGLGVGLVKHGLKGRL